MKTYIVQLDQNDDVISARDKISWSKANRVLLIWPRRGRVLGRQIDLLLLKRHAQHAGTQLAFVTSDSQVKIRAEELGIPVFRKAEQAQQVTWRRGRRYKRILRRRSPRVDPYSLRSQRGSLAAAVRLNQKIRLAAFSVGILSVLVLVLFFAPGAEIELTPARAENSLVIPVWASPALSTASSSGGIPAQVLAVVVEGRDEAPVTGKASVPDTAAKGTVQLTNLTDQKIFVPAGSFVMTASNPIVRFITTRDVSVAAGAGQRMIVDIQAVELGSSGNIPSGKILAMEGPLGLRLVVQNLASTHGGREWTSPAPGARDYQLLREKLRAALRITAQEEMKGMLQSGQRLLAETLQANKVIEETGEPAENQPGDRLMISMRVQFQALAVKEADLQQVAHAALNANLDRGYRPVAGSQKITFASAPAINAGTADDPRSVTARWDLRIEQLLEKNLPVESLVREVQGSTISEASSKLQASEGLEKPPQIKIWPPWWPRMPFLPFRIRVVQP